MNYFSLIITISLILIACFLALMPPADSWIVTVYKISMLDYYFFVFLMVSGLLLLLCKMIPVVRWCIPVMASFWLLYLIADLIVFSLYHFHINPLIISMVVFDFSGLGLPVSVIISIILAVILLLMINLFLWKYRHDFV